MSTPFFGKKTPDAPASSASDNNTSNSVNALRQSSGSLASSYGGVSVANGASSNHSAAAQTSRSPQVDASAQTPANTGSKLTVGPNIKLKGVEITDCDTLVVEGLVEATMDSRVIQIAEQGAFRGAAEIDIAEIRGEFSGNLTVRQKLVIYATGKVTGTIRYGKLVIEEGGQLSGEVHFGMEGSEKSSVSSDKTNGSSVFKTAAGLSASDASHSNSGNGLAGTSHHLSQAIAAAA